MGLTVNLVALEILVVNLFTTHQCSKNRLSTKHILLLYAFFTVLVMVLVQWVLRPTLPSPLDTEGLYLFIGLLYFIPLSIAYDQPFKRTALIMFTAWIYTTIIYAFSGRIFSLLSTFSDYVILLIQTGLIITTYGLFYAFIRRKFLYVLSHADENTVSTSLLLSVLWFLVVWLINLDFHYNSLVIDISVMMLLVVSIFLTYLVFNTLTLAEETKKAMTDLTLHDELTGLRNRDALRKDMLGLIEAAIPFTVVFMDLDRFKSINDDYGHAQGDSYLKQFSRSIEAMYKESADLYRMSGDEFVLIHTNRDNTKVCHQIEAFSFDEEYELDFLGVSVGCASYPDDATTASELLHTADTNMYQVKKKRHAAQATIYNREDD